MNLSAEVAACVSVVGGLLVLWAGLWVIDRVQR